MTYACAAEESSEIAVDVKDYKETGEEETLNSTADFVTSDEEQSGEASEEAVDSSTEETSSGFPGLTLPSFELDEIEVANIDGELDSSPIGLDAILNINFQEVVSFSIIFSPGYSTSS